jgi:hypothetical protein
MPHFFMQGQEGEDLSFGSICNCPVLQNEGQFQWVSNWTRTSGNHMVKWGADIRIYRALEKAHVAEQERGQAQSAAARPLSAGVKKNQGPRARSRASHAQVLGVTFT